MRERQEADGHVAEELAAGGENAVVGAAHEGAVGENGALGRARGAAGEEDGGGRVLVYLRRRRLGFAERGRGDLRAGGSFDGGAELVPDDERLGAEFRAAADHGRGGELRGQHHGHQAGGGDGQETLHGVDGILLEDGHVVAGLEPCFFIQGAPAGDAAGHLFISKRIDGVGKGGAVGPLGGDPVEILGDGREVVQLGKLLGRDHVVEVIGHFL